MSLSFEQKSNVRRHLDFPVAGLARVSPSGGTLAQGNAGYRFFQAWGQLEYRLNNLAPDEEARLLGIPLGSVSLVGPGMPLGTVLSVTFTAATLTNSPVTVTYTSVATDNQLSAIASLASNCNANTNLQTFGIVAIAPYGTGPYSQAQSYAGSNPVGAGSIPVAEVGFTSINGTTFTLAASSTNNVSAVVTSQGTMLGPSAQVAFTGSTPTVVNGYLPICDYLEGAIVGATQNLSTSVAGPWTARAREFKERKELYEWWRKSMHRYLFGTTGQTGSFGMTGMPFAVV